MTAADLAALPPIRFSPASEAPVSPQWCLVAPICDEWLIARRDAEGWVNTDEGYVAGELVVYAPLPSAPGVNSPRMAGLLVRSIGRMIEQGDYAAAATLVDHLADRVRTLRDSTPA